MLTMSQGLQCRTRLLLNGEEKALAAMREGRFILSGTRYFGKFGKFGIIQPGEWQFLAKPDMSVCLSIQDVDEQYATQTGEPRPTDDQSDSNDLSDSTVEVKKELAYSTRTRYTTEFHSKSDRHGAGVFLHRTFTDCPLPWKRESQREIPVLEEIRRVARGTVHSDGTFADDENTIPSRLPSMADPLFLPPSRFSGAIEQSALQPDLTYYETLFETDQTTKIQLHIHSKPLLNALRAVVSYASSDRSSENLENGTFSYPYQLLFHNKDVLQVYKESGNINHSNERSEQTAEHIEHLIEFLYSQPSLRLGEVEKQWNSAVPVVAFKDLWLLFRPGEDVYVEENGDLNAYVLDFIDGPTPSESIKNYDTRAYSLGVWNIDFDGTSLGRSSRMINIGYFQGNREIMTLPIYPQRFHLNTNGSSSRKEALVERGKHFAKLCKQSTLQEYTGKGSFHGVKQYTKRRVMADHTARPWMLSELKDHNLHIPKRSIHNNTWPHRSNSLGDEVFDRPFVPLPPPPPPSLGRVSSPAAGKALPRGCRCDECLPLDSSGFKVIDFHLIFSEYDNISPAQYENLTSHQYMLCSPWFYAFILKDRKWDLLEVSGLQDPCITRSAIDSLVMPIESKDMIRAICETYLQRMSGKQFFTADIIKGKGEGQIFLLHGPPGTGKTLTAAGDLGSEPTLLEERLLRYFRNGNDWDAVILLDEADIFLHERGDDDLERNSIVSVFLRAMDYFEGILFLTTNRVGVIDEAIKSRIHMQIGFDELNNDARNKIWNTNFERLRRAEIKLDYAYSAKEYVEQSREVRDLNLNGREIRNAFQTAVALAVDEDYHNEAGQTVLSEKHLSAVMRMSMKFRDYMRKTNKADDATLAHARGHRYDRPEGAK
ncbi:MAG: hypothetical protein M1821_003509 [Bathelium mastoideum]|nr:MAG: hypothetical protein M1821_003509 [Bathelium mastoideum]